MISRIAIVASVLLTLSPAASRASNFQLSLQITPDANIATGTWTVLAASTDNQNLGLASFAIDVVGTSGTSIQRATIASQTNQTPSNVYSIFRTNGTVSGTNLLNIFASQDSISAANNNEDSGLRFGDGLLTDATGTFKGQVTHGGPIVLASGRYTNVGFMAL